MQGKVELSREQDDDPEVLHLQLRDVVHWDLEAHRDRPHLLAHVVLGPRRDEFAREVLHRAAHELADQPRHRLGRVVKLPRLPLGLRRRGAK